MTEHIQINDVAPRIHYDADGVQSAFTYPFAIFKIPNLEVWLGDVRQDSGFSVSGAGISSGGSVLFVVPPPAGTRVTLRRRLILERVSDYQADGIIRAKTLNDELDYQVAALQQVAEDVERSLKLPPTSASLAELTLPEPAAGRGLKWSPSGLSLVNSDHDPDTLGNAVQAAADAVAAAGIATAACDQALAAVGGVKVSANDATVAALTTKLVAGNGIFVTELSDGGDERLSIAASGVPQAIVDRLDFLERNLAITVLRDQIDTGWSVLKMVDGIADEFEDETGIAIKTGATYDSTGDYYHNAGGLGADVMPAFTGYSSGNWTISSSNDTNGAAWTVGDNGIVGFWNTVATVGHWWETAYGGMAVTIGGYSIQADETYYGRAPKSWTYEAWNGTAWAVKDTRTNVAAWGSNETRTYILAAPVILGSGGAYSKTRFNISDHYGGTTLLVDEFQQLAYVTPTNMMLSSAVAFADAQPVEARLVLLHQPVGSVALNTDIIAEVSRNGGTTWTAGTLIREGAFDGTTNVVSAVVDLSGQPVGTAMAWRLRTLNNKEQRLHGVWLQWR